LQNIEVLCRKHGRKNSVSDKVIYYRKVNGEEMKNNTKMSVCIITRDQQDKLRKCLTALKPYPVQVVVADTGSLDDSRKVAREFTPFVYDLTWKDDFAEAKNAAVEKAEGDLVLVLDTDEYLETFQYEELCRLAEENPGNVGRIERQSKYSQDGQEQEYDEWINRIFDRRLFHYQGMIHEQLVRKEEAPYNTYLAPVRIWHDGYDLSQTEYRKKAERNITLLCRALEKTPEDPYLLYQLGKSYYILPDYDKAGRQFELAMGYHPDLALEYVEDLIETYGYTLLKTQQTEHAMGLLEYEPVFAKSADFLFLAGMIRMNNTRFEEAVATFLKATGLKPARTRGTNSYMAWYNAGVIRECMGKVSEAAEFYRMCGDYEPARKGLKRIGR